MATLKDSYSSALTAGVETVVLGTTDAGVYQVRVDTDALLNGESLRIEISVKTLTGSGLKIIYDVTIIHATGTSVIYDSVPIVSLYEIEVTLTQTGGTGHAYECALYSL